MLLRTFGLVALCLIATTAVRADVLTLEGGGERSARLAPLDVKLPTRGMSMTRVLTEFGEPASRRAPIGEPPISRWVYDTYTVYFEHQYVIHAVLNR